MFLFCACARLHLVDCNYTFRAKHTTHGLEASFTFVFYLLLGELPGRVMMKNQFEKVKTKRF